nr:signal peptidase complex subunit 1 [Quercus suber]
MCPRESLHSRHPKERLTDQHCAQDFKGQALADFLSTTLLVIAGIVSFLAGWFTNNIYNTLYVGLGGTALTFLIVVPPWPVYNRNPLPWLPAKTARRTGGGRANLQGIDLGGVSVDGQKLG